MELIFQGRKLGAIKKVANNLGIDLQDYLARMKSGQKYCYGCKTWKEQASFTVDLSRGDGLSSLCKECKYQKGITRKPRNIEIEKRRAHRAIYMRVLRRKLANPNSISCFDCGHFGNDRRHEYDHYNGYLGEAKFQVQAVCSLCHAKRHKERKGLNG